METIKKKSNILERMRRKQAETNEVKGRYPHGTQLAAEYSAITQSWRIVMIINGEKHEVTANGIHWGIQRLGKNYFRKDKEKGQE